MDSFGTGLKSSRKRKKHPTGNSSTNDLKKKKFSKNSDASTEFVKKKSFKNKIAKPQSDSSATIQNSTKSVESMKVNTQKKLKKNVLKNKEIANSKSQSKHNLNSKKNKKFKNVPAAGTITSPSGSKDKSQAVRNASKAKKKKKRKLTPKVEENTDSESNDELSDICISDDDESDEEILREEIQSSSIFKQIEKLMKKAPHLNPANADLEPSEDVSDASEFSLSGNSDNEDSEMEIDEQNASSESDLEDSDLKNETSSKKVNTVAVRQNKNVQMTNKNNNFTESIGFNRTSKDNALKRTSSDKDKKGDRSSSLKNKVQEKLAGAKFRFLNEKLYTETGKEAFKYFQENKEEFEDYHSGYRLQVTKWPMNPVNEIIADIQKLKKSSVIADLGCGEAKIAQTFPDRTIHSFDLVPLNEFVKACDISKIPLPNESVDVVVFCLSLMGTNLRDYLCEAFRILKVGGTLKIAEVESRIEDLNNFIKYLKTVGFNLVKKNTKHKMFVFLDLKKEKQKRSKKVPSLSLRPCLYKKR